MTITEIKTVLRFLESTGTCSYEQLDVLSNHIVFKVPQPDEKETVEVVADIHDPIRIRFIVYQEAEGLFYYWGA